jgi:hypothetical protein
LSDITRSGLGGQAHAAGIGLRHSRQRRKVEDEHHTPVAKVRGADDIDLDQIVRKRPHDFSLARNSVNGNRDSPSRSDHERVKRAPRLRRDSEEPAQLSTGSTPPRYGAISCASIARRDADRAR